MGGEFAHIHWVLSFAACFRLFAKHGSVGRRIPDSGFDLQTLATHGRRIMASRFTSQVLQPEMWQRRDWDGTGPKEPQDFSRQSMGLKSIGCNLRTGGLEFALDHWLRRCPRVCPDQLLPVGNWQVIEKAGQAR